MIKDINLLSKGKIKNDYIKTCIWRTTEYGFSISFKGVTNTCFISVSLLTSSAFTSFFCKVYKIELSLCKIVDNLNIILSHIISKKSSRAWIHVLETIIDYTEVSEKRLSKKVMRCMPREKTNEGPKKLWIAK